MNDVVKIINEKLLLHDLKFSKTPLVIGGMAMEYYGIRSAGADIDLIIHDSDYQLLADKFPAKRKDIWGDLGIVIDPFEIWRSIMLFDYDFFSQDAISHDGILIMSLEKLLFSRACATGIKTEQTKHKYKIDLELIEKHYYEKYTNKEFTVSAELNFAAYNENGGIIYGGNYQNAPPVIGNR